MADWRVAAAVEYAENRRKLVLHRQSQTRIAEDALAEVKTTDAALSELDRAARAFNLPIEPPSSEEEAQGALFVAPAPKAEGLIKDIILEFLREAYPSPMKAKAIKSRLEEKIGRSVHDKTPGMTLFRLAKEERVRRTGHDWYFVPQPEEGVG